MQNFKKVIICTMLCFLSGYSLAADEDSSFTIDITGPETDYNQVQTTTRSETPNRVTRTIPRTTTRTQIQQTRNNGQATTARNTRVANSTVRNVAKPNATYTIKGQDTIWQIASALIPASRVYNEYQIIASLYRNNPHAFENGNVNRLLTGARLVIPSYQAISKERTQTGIDLLQGNITNLPSLDNNQSVTTSSSNQVGQNTETKQTATLFTSDSQLQNNLDNLISQLRTENNVTTISATQPNTDELNKEAVNNDKEKSIVNVENALQSAVENQKKPEPKINPIDVNTIDVKAILKVIDDLESDLNKRQDKIQKDLANSLIRAENIAKNTASQAAKTEVESAIANYDSVISELQQSNVEMRATIARLNKQIDQVREMTLQTTDQLATLEGRMMTISPKSTISNQGPMMLILLGGGILCLVMAITLFIFKRKSRESSKALNDDDILLDEDDPGQDELITSSISPEVGNAVHDAEESKDVANKDESQEKLTSDKQSTQDGELQSDNKEVAIASKDSSASNENYVDEEIEIPQEILDKTNNSQNNLTHDDELQKAVAAWNEAASDTTSDNSQNENVKVKESLNKWSENIKEKESDLKKINIGATNTEVNTTSENASSVADKDLVEQLGNNHQEQNSKNVQVQDKSAAERLAASLNEQKTAPQVEEEKSADEKLAEQWAASLNEQKTAPQAEEEKSADEKLAEQWAASLNEQKTAPQAEEEKSADEKLAEQWAASLNEQKAAPQVEEEKSADEKLAEQWAASLNEQKTAPQAEEEKSADEKLAEQWAANLNEQNSNVVSLNNTISDEIKQTDTMDYVSPSSKAVASHSADKVQKLTEGINKGQTDETDKLVANHEHVNNNVAIHNDTFDNTSDSEQHLASALASSQQTTADTGAITPNSQAEADLIASMQQSKVSVPSIAEQSLNHDEQSIKNMLQDRAEPVKIDPVDYTKSIENLDDHDIVSMISDINSQAVKLDHAVNHDDKNTDFVVDNQKISTDEQPKSAFVEQVTASNDMFNKHNQNITPSLDDVQLQRYSDELNLAHLYFETGDNDEAMIIVNKVMDCGNQELINKAKNLLEKYGEYK